ncbi:MAG: TVP38/TMEM64 family protein [Candidatus Woesearchaeota archaeon]
MNEKHHKKIIWLGVLFVLLLLVLVFFSVKNSFDGNIEETIKGFGIFAPLLFFLIQFLESIIPFFPGFILTVMGGYLFGPWVGLVIAVFAVLLGSSLVFFASRRFEKTIFHNLPTKELRHFEKFIEKKGILAILLSRFLPIFPNVVVSFSAGLSKISYSKFMLFSLMGLLPQQIVLSFFGFSLGAEFSRFSLIFAAVFVLIIIIFSFRHRIKKMLLKDLVFIEKEISEFEESLE